MKETFIDILQSVLSYVSVAAREIWSALASPENVPIFMSSLIKFSLGPTLAFLWGRRAFKQEEKIRNDQEKERDEEKSKAIKTMLKMEIDYNFERIKSLVREYEILLVVPSEKRGKGSLYISPHGFQTKALDSLIDRIPHVLTTPEIKELYKMYGDFRAVAYAYDTRQPKVIHSMDDTEKSLCDETLRHLKLCSNSMLSNPLFISWFQNDNKCNH